MTSELNNIIDHYSLEDTVDYMTKTMEEITSSNPDFRDQTDGLTQWFRDYANQIIRSNEVFNNKVNSNKVYRYKVYENIIGSLSNIQKIDLELGGLLLSASVSQVSINLTNIYRYSI